MVYEHRDILNRVINVGDYVAIPVSNSLEVATVVKLNPKMIKVHNVKDRRLRYTEGQNKYPSDCVVLSGPELTAFILKL